MATVSTDTNDRTSTVSLTSGLDRAGELQIQHQGKPIESLDLLLKKDSSLLIAIQPFADWTLGASHFNKSLGIVVAWEVDRSGGVGHTFAGSASVTVTVTATQSSSSTTKKKDIKITIKPVGSDKGPGGKGHS